MEERLRLGDPADVGRLLREEKFRVDHPFRVSRRVFGASTLDLEGSEHLKRKRGWWAGFGKQWAGSVTVQEMVDSAVADGFARARVSNDLLQGCVYIPNRIVLDLLDLPEVDPIEHYESLKPVLRILGGLPETDDSVAQAKDYIQRLVRDVTVPWFSDLSNEARSAELALFLVAGAETTVVALEVLTSAWWNDADAVTDAVRSAGSASVVMRLLTQDAPLGLTTRYASRDVFIDTVGQIPRGALIEVDLASASLQLGIGETDDRRKAQSYVFGAGAHRCPGDRLAMLEAQAYLGGLLALDASEYAPVAAAEPRPATFRHLPWQALERTTNSRAGAPAERSVGDA
ncbi:hypothetical protein AB0K35_02315 [Micromonospora sp. NPDC053740]|uniref:hypothetical protein n=1 Tax=Micromonospora sp. NPDC053740 TaxID=3155173 RepID=UPI003418AA63